MRTDLGLDDKYGAQLSLTWRADGGATLAVDDGYEDNVARIDLDGDGLLRIAANILCGLSNTDETVNRIIAACRAGDGPPPFKAGPLPSTLRLVVFDEEAGP